MIHPVESTTYRGLELMNIVILDESLRQWQNENYPENYAKTYAGVLGVDRTLASRYPGCCPVASKNKAHESSGTGRLPDSQ